MTTSINNTPSFGRTVPPMLQVSREVNNFKKAAIGQPKADLVMLKKCSGQDTSISSYKRRLKDIEKHLKECKRENYETQEEFEKEYNYWTEKYDDIQQKMKEADTSYTTVNTEANTKKMGAFGKLFKDCCEGIKTLGIDLVNAVLGFFGAKKIA